MLLEIDGRIVFANVLAHIGGKEEVFEGVSNSTFISDMFFILPSQVENIRKDANQADKVDDRYKKHDKGYDNNKEGSIEIVADLFDERVTDHNLHFWTTLFRIFIVSVDDLIVPWYECGLFSWLCLDVEYNQRGFYWLVLHAEISN